MFTLISARSTLFVIAFTVKLTLRDTVMGMYWEIKLQYQTMSN